MDRRGDPGLRDRLRHPGSQRQHEAVLAWLIKGAVRWYQSGGVMPEPPAAVVAARDAWQSSVDLLLRYAGDNLVPDPDYHVMSTELYQDFAQWLRDNGHTMWSDQLFGARFAQHPRVEAKSVTKKRVRKSAAGQTLSRRQTWAGSYAHTPPAEQYWAWLGVRFRTPNDVIAGDGRNGW
jgi:putative DNA primase/helicase